jgi:hypothetical protein
VSSVVLNNRFVPTAFLGVIPIQSLQPKVFAALTVGGADIQDIEPPANPPSGTDLGHGVPSQNRGKSQSFFAARYKAGIRHKRVGNRLLHELGLLLRPEFAKCRADVTKKHREQGYEPVLPSRRTGLLHLTCHGTIS